MLENDADNDAIIECVSLSFIPSARGDQLVLTDSSRLDRPFFFFFLFPFLELYSPPTPSTPLISNPGCFATNTQLLLAPLLPHLSLTESPTVFGISGYSGAGTKAGSVPKVSAESLSGGVKPYSLTDHIHEREAGFRLGGFTLNKSPMFQSTVLNASRAIPFAVNFIPSVAPWFQGIISTVSAPLEKSMRASEVKALYDEMYEGKKLIQVGSAVPEIKDIAGKHGVKIGGIQVHSSGKRVVVVVSLFYAFIFFLFRISRLI